MHYPYVFYKITWKNIRLFEIIFFYNFVDCPPSSCMYFLSFLKCVIILNIIVYCIFICLSWFIYCFYYVLCFSSLSRPWFIQLFTFVRVIAAGCIYYFLCLSFLYFVDCVNIIFCNGRSDGSLHHIRFFPHDINPFFDKCFGSSDQWLFVRHDLGAWSYLPGLLQNQSIFWIAMKLSFKRTGNLN